MSRWYKQKKEEFDNMVYGYLIKRLKDPIDQSDAFFMGSVDEFGNELKNESNWAYTKLDKLLIAIKRSLGQDVINKLPNDYNDVDTYSLMNGAVDPKEYSSAYKGVISLVEECQYLPPEQRGHGDYVDDDPELSVPERIQRALTCANYLMFAILNNDAIPSSIEFNDTVLPSVEATFGIRSIGSDIETADYLKAAGLIDYKNITNQGFVLAVRLAKWIKMHKLCDRGFDNVDNFRKSWEKLSNAG
ncbi:MAG: hypothetical protein MJZ25_04020 [Fibrobacter sp.]|nr:hypothetical protein [Fibrobacter sp.]